MSDEASDIAPRRSLREWLTDLFADDEPEDRSALMTMLRDAADRQIMDADALNIIFGALQVSDMQARDIMIPRSQLIVLNVDDAPKDLLPHIIKSQHSRYPVIGDGMDDVRGILHAKDLLPLVLADSHADFDIKDCIRPATMVPESKRLNVLLQEFRINRNHMALVVDEYGQVAGAVTIEDVLEQIVGEIEDEHDVHDDGFVKQLDDTTYTVKATTTVEDFNEFFDQELDDEQFDTIGGLVLREFGYLPKRGETVSICDMDVKVLNADSRRLRLLQFKRPA